MQTKTELLDLLMDEFARWENLLAPLTEAQLTTPSLPAGLSIKDVVAHLMAWQQRSIARVQAARDGLEPQFPNWPAGLDPEAEDVDAVNAWIYTTYRHQPWPSVYQQWRAGFRTFIEISAALSEADLFTPGRFAWMDPWLLADVLRGSYEHHHVEHYLPLSVWLAQAGLP